MRSGWIAVLVVGPVIAAACAGSPTTGGGDDGSGNVAGVPGTSGASNGVSGSGVGSSGTPGTVGSGGAPGSSGTTGTGGTGPVGSGGTAGSAVGSGGATGGRGGATGAGGTANTAGRPGTAGAGAGPAVCPTVTWPTATGSMNVSATIPVSGVYDGTMKRFIGTGALGRGDQAEGQDPIFMVANGGTLKNVILGTPAADGVHCAGSCTIQNVWWEDVGEDALTSLGTASTTAVTIDGGGAKFATDKVIQSNGSGTVTIRNFYAQGFGKLYRSCGNCPDQFKRRAVLQNIIAVNTSGQLVGLNTNYGDSATFTGITICDNTRKMTVCDRYTGNTSGAEPVLTGSGADGTFCIYTPADIHTIP